MDTAIDLFRAGVPVLARGTDHVSASVMRLVCPKCMELVNLVIRGTNSYFAHQPWKAGAPPCSLRVESWGNLSPRRGSGPHEIRPPNTRFRDALLAAFSLTEPPEAPTGGADSGQAATIMHLAFQANGRTVAASDFPDASPFLLDWWTTDDEEMIRGFLDRPGVLKNRLREDLRGDPRLKGEEHRRSVLLLWTHLHHPQVIDDLLFLLNVTAHLFRPPLLADLVVTSLGVLAWVPWAVLWAPDRKHVCDECGRTFTLPASEEPACCSECSKECLCPDCAIPCSVCRDILCEHCVYGSCPACSDVLCSTCSHFDWECTSCGRVFCEGGDEEPPEEVEKIECDGCREPFCGDCAEDALEDWQGKSLCESCRDERRQEAEEAEEERTAAQGQADA